MGYMFDVSKELISYAASLRLHFRVLIEVETEKMVDVRSSDA